MTGVKMTDDHDERTCLIWKQHGEEGCCKLMLINFEIRFVILFHFIKIFLALQVTSVR